MVTASRCKVVPVMAAFAAVLSAASLGASSAPAAHAHATALAEYSFKPPFADFDENGRRRVSSNWRVGNAAVVNQNFLRLTPDRPSRTGYAWSSVGNTQDEWSATIRFRVSGSSRQMYGDGFAVWFTQDTNHRDGPIHGYADRFIGS